ncbi:SLIT-ROBO Rho GTPase-activating protein 3 [Branchiostoma belcheri]|nr:SLIT-ROBO Rho GTPase-activating protein 3 [Branchiostoma belcheri]
MYLRRRALRRRRVGRRRERYHEIQRAAIFAVIAIIQAQGGIDREVLANAFRTISRVYTRRGGILTPRWAIVHDRTSAFEGSPEDSPVYLGDHLYTWVLTASKQPVVGRQMLGEHLSDPDTSGDMVHQQACGEDAGFGCKLVCGAGHVAACSGIACRGMELGEGGGGAARNTSVHIRQQLTDQLKCLDSRMEAQAALMADLQDFFRRKAEIELEYSKSLEKLADRFLTKVKQQQKLDASKTGEKKDGHILSPYNCWYQLLGVTRRESRNHSTLSDIYSNNLTSRFTQISEDVGRIFRKSREITTTCHEDLVRVLNELYTVSIMYG